jgi:hypothetical protein
MNLYQPVLRSRRTTKGLLAAAFSAAVFVTAGIATGTVGAAGATYVVDEDGMATGNNCNSSTPTSYMTIASAVAAAAAGDTVKVCPGTYTENLVLDKALMLKGAKSGVDFGSRTFGNASESTVTGLVTLAAADVKVDGFSFTNPNQGLGVLVKTAANNALIRNNFVKTVGSNTFTDPAVGIYLELGPDSVQIDNNSISNIQSNVRSAQGILVGDSSSGNPSLETELTDNTISDITSVARGAYGILVNNGASAVATATGYTELSATDNTVKNLSGSWAHGFGLEGETPNAVVENNTFQNLTDTNPTPVNDSVAVFFEANPFFFTSEVTRNNLGIGATNYGIALHPNLAAQYPSLSVDGECNWWGNKSGAGAVGTGAGSLVGTNVDYKPALKSSKLNSDCGNKNDHDGDRHVGDWGDWGYKKWGND